MTLWCSQLIEQSMTIQIWSTWRCCVLHIAHFVRFVFAFVFVFVKSINAYITSWKRRMRWSNRCHDVINMMSMRITAERNNKEIECECWVEKVEKLKYDMIKVAINTRVVGMKDLMSRIKIQSSSSMQLKSSSTHTHTHTFNHMINIEISQIVALKEKISKLRK